MVLAIIAAIAIGVGVVWAVMASASQPPAPAETSAAPSAQPSGAPSEPAPAGSASAAPTAPPAHTGSPNPASDSPIAPEAAPVAPTEVAEQEIAADQLVRVLLALVEQVEGEALAPGEIAGPAIRLTIEVVNDTDAAIDAGLIAVNTYFGAERAPGNSLMQPGGDPFAGSIAPGQSARGVYLFEAADAALADVLVGVDVVPGQPTFTFRGDLR
ncbi:hypothetical protein [Agrococcus sp. Marseille-P2731]|uniref:hypothetical protein n=1 Tax=Agrococcus sp. Marseille-P2731 TaxID=1841862 RepID=UPI0009316CA2|nr:hypothetical protein [Agrococcus sp. Marseille-P2731]